MKKEDLEHAEKSAILASIIAILVVILVLIFNSISHGQTIEQLNQELKVLRQQMESEKQQMQPLLEIAEKAEEHATKFMEYNDKLKYVDAVKYGFYVEAYSRKRDLDSDLVVAIIITESHANYLAKSCIGAIGLMQIHYKVWKKEIKKTQKELYNPKTNIRYGTKILKYYLDKYDGNALDAVMAYNTGSGSARKFRISQASPPVAPASPFSTS